MLEGRIIKGVGGLYTVETLNGFYFCKARGIFRKDNITPTVGDNVKISVVDESEREGIIEEIKERKNIFLRPRVSNIDLAIIVFSAAEPLINLDLLDRFIILSEEQNLDVLICINKMDLVDSKNFDSIKTLYENIGYKIELFSCFENDFKDRIISIIENKVSVLAGPSGVGKSSIANLLSVDINMETGEISKKNKRGKHTTRHAELLQIKDNTFIVDSPGFTSISINHIEPENLQFLFKEFRNFLGTCRFNDCLHLNEPDCSVKKEVGISITEERYTRYKLFLDELLKWRK